MYRSARSTSADKQQVWSVKNIGAFTCAVYKRPNPLNVLLGNSGVAGLLTNNSEVRAKPEPFGPVLQYSDNSNRSDGVRQRTI